MSRTWLAWAGFVSGAIACGVLPVTPVDPAAATQLIDCVSSDNGDPELTDARFSPSVVDVSSGPVTVTLTATVRDTGGPGAASGVRSARVSVGQGDGELGWIRLREMASGDWGGRLTVSRWLRGGRWWVDGAQLRDRVGHESGYGNVALADASFTVIPTGDRAGPRLSGFTFHPGLVDTTREPAQVRVAARVRDDQSGVARVQVWLATPSGRFASATLSEQPATLNTWRGKAVIPRWIGSATWRAYVLTVEDRAGNLRYYFTGRLVRLGFKTQLRVVSRRDNVRPTVTGFQREPGAVDVRAGAREVSVAIRAKDTQSGVGSVRAAFRSPGRLKVNVKLERVSGTRRDGLWRGTLLVPQCPAISGRLKGRVSVTDHRGNQTRYPARELRRRGWPSALGVTARADALPPRAHVAPNNSFDVPIAGPVVVRFNEPVQGLTRDSATVRLVEMPLIGGAGPVITGTWGRCLTGSGTASNCVTGRIRKASFHPDEPLEPSEAEPMYYQLDLNPEHTLDATDLAGNPFDRFSVYFFTAVR
jgi:hypothetical protein